jgi:hypothetical protein
LQTGDDVGKEESYVETVHDSGSSESAGLNSGVEDLNSERDDLNTDRDDLRSENSFPDSGLENGE